MLIFFGVIAVGGSYYVQRLTYDVRALLAGIAVGLLAVVLLAINNLRDIESDRASNKKTLAVRFGPTFGRMEIAACVLLPFVLIFPIAWTPLAAFPLVVFLIRTTWHAKGTHLNRCLALAGLLQWTFGILFVVGMVL